MIYIALLREMLNDILTLFQTIDRFGFYRYIMLVLLAGIRTLVLLAGIRTCTLASLGKAMAALVTIPAPTNVSVSVVGEGVPMVLHRLCWLWQALLPRSLGACNRVHSTQGS